MEIHSFFNVHSFTKTKQAQDLGAFGYTVETVMMIAREIVGKEKINKK